MALILSMLGMREGKFGVLLFYVSLWYLLCVSLVLFMCMFAIVYVSLWFCLCACLL